VYVCTVISYREVYVCTVVFVYVCKAKLNYDIVLTEEEFTYTSSFQAQIVVDDVRR
jgi:hypothetical protein